MLCNLNASMAVDTLDAWHVWLGWCALTAEGTEGLHTLPSLCSLRLAILCPLFLALLSGRAARGGSLTYSAPCSNRSMACARSELTRRVMGISKRLAHWYRGGIRSSRIFGEYTMPLYSLWVV